MKFLLKFILRALIILLICHYLPGTTLDSGTPLENFKTALIVAIGLGLLNTFVKPLLVLFTIPITFLTLGLFLLIINGLIVLIAARLIPGFHVDGLLSGLIFSVILSILSWFVEKFIGDKDKKKKQKKDD
ncbi:MAG: phage holin family protein [Chitinophagales bacterium]|nr:phage holin family protein [Chitinophagales bacterium]